MLLENAWFPQVAPAQKYEFIAVECEIIAMGIFSGRYPPAILATAISAILASAGIMTEAQTEALRDDVQQLREKGGGGEGGRCAGRRGGRRAKESGDDANGGRKTEENDAKDTEDRAKGGGEGGARGGAGARTGRRGARKTRR